MSQKIAIAIIHGLGTANPEFANEKNPDKFVSGIAQQLKSRFSALMGEKLEDADSKLKIKPVYWAPVLQDIQDELGKRLSLDSLNNFFGLREFVFHSLADSIGYQITPTKRNIYDAVHQKFAETLTELAEDGGEKYPLCVIGHSLGSVIASNYIWDLQNETANIEIGNTPLQKGETLSLFYTLGSQIALWRLRYSDFGTPIAVPSVELSKHYPKIKGEWLNFYDRDDILGYPVKNINDKYKAVVKADIEVNAGNALINFTPLSHNGYWTDSEVIEPIAQGLVKTWKRAYL
ncbi:hypothetical protein Cylst_0306 [Cylindrospermum stagnale PCC 7417]|uniref:Chemotaxis protein n=1 Tax=Cylindrospermum stagnale PCC 7417 TaxID=56107 RepID=K9WS97_9NOST|nr:hypothetical protein [Cylindrospermum stagnale]AFZ22669.1 hypothetical protein Cylst_0306 [Cylindrospermum stagnale PCC 7417]